MAKINNGNRKLIYSTQGKSGNFRSFRNVKIDMQGESDDFIIAFKFIHIELLNLEYNS